MDPIRAPEESRSSRVGSARTPVRGSDGPIARTITFFDCVPVIMNPPIKTLSPVATRKRVEIFPKAPAVGVGVGMGVPVAVAVGVAVTVEVAVGVAVGSTVGVAVAVGVTVADTVGVAVAVAVGVAVAVAVGVAVGVEDGA